jgi:hypothetical protein
LETNDKCPVTRVSFPGEVKEATRVLKLEELYVRLKSDPERDRFSDDIEAVHKRILAGNIADSEAQERLNGWVKEHQPCLFGRIAAQQGLLRYCILDERAIMQGEAAIRERIQNGRSRWWADGFIGQASGFIIAVISERLAFAKPVFSQYRWSARNEHQGAESVCAKESEVPICS